MFFDGALVRASDTFHLVILPGSEQDKRHSQILAQYGSARVLEDFFLGGAGNGAGKRWQRIIGFQEKIRSYINDGKGQMPADKELVDFGEVLFETLLILRWLAVDL